MAWNSPTGEITLVGLGKEGREGNGKIRALIIHLLGKASLIVFSPDLYRALVSHERFMVTLMLQPRLCWALTNQEVPLSVLWSFPWSWQWDVGRTIARLCWSLWWISGCVCHSSWRGLGRQGWRVRAEQALTTRLCRYSWKVSERQGHCGQAGSEWQSGLCSRATLGW